MDAAQWPQGIGMEGSRGTIITGESRRPRPEKDKQALNCPRCNSTNTKFCYYNNYSLSQPRYMCKTCKRYWTAGGTLRNVPVGGGSRKNINNKRRSSPVLPPSSSKKQLPHHHHDLTAPNSFPQSSTASQTSQNPNNKIHQGQDLNLAYPWPPPPPTTGSYKYTPCSSSQISSMELFNFKKYEIASIYSCGFPMQELIKPPSLNYFGVDGYGNLQGVLQESGSSSRSSGSTSRLFFPFEDLKMQQQAAQSSTTTSTNIADHEFYGHEKKAIRGELGGDDQQAITGYWSSGMLGGGGGGSWLA